MIKVVLSIFASCEVGNLTLVIKRSSATLFNTARCFLCTFEITGKLTAGLLS